LLDLLRRLGDSVVVPTAVVLELNAGRQAGVSLPDVAAISWISIARSANPRFSHSVWNAAAPC